MKRLLLDLALFFSTVSLIFLFIMILMHKVGYSHDNSKSSAITGKSNITMIDKNYREIKNGK